MRFSSADVVLDGRLDIAVSDYVGALVRLPCDSAANPRREH